MEHIDGQLDVYECIDGQLDVYECIEVAETGSDGKPSTDELSRPETPPKRYGRVVVVGGRRNALVKRIVAEHLQNGKDAA